jgi:hypothetical protein
MALVKLVITMEVDSFDPTIIDFRWG